LKMLNGLKYFDDGQILQQRIGYLLKRPVGRPPIEVRRYYANFSYQAKSWSKSRRVIAKVEWRPGELYPTVGFIVTNMTRPAERVVAFYNQRGTAEQWIKEGKNAIKWTQALMLLLRRQRRASSVACAGLQSRQLHADAGSAGGDQAVVADEPAGESRQDRRQGRAPWPLRHLPDGRGRRAEGIVPGNLAADRRTATKTGSSVGTEGVGCVITTGGVCLNDKEKGQIGGSNVVGDAEDDGNAASTAQTASGLRGTPPSAIVRAVPEFIWGMSVKPAFPR